MPLKSNSQPTEKLVDHEVSVLLSLLQGGFDKMSDLRGLGRIATRVNKNASLGQYSVNDSWGDSG